MIFDGLSLGGNVVMFTLLAVALVLLTTMFLIGRMERLKRRGTEQLSIEMLRQMRAEEEKRNDSLRKEKEGILKEARRAEDVIERWEMVKRDHERLEEMRRELDEFEREESRRIDELERRRTEAARRLGDIQAALDPYPPEITGDDGPWEEALAERRRIYNELIEATENAEKEYAEADARRTQAAEEAAKIERKMMRLEGEIEAAQKQLDQSMPSREETIGKLSAFRSMPDCLFGYQEARAKTDEEDLLDEFEETLGNLGLQYPTQVIRAFHTALKVNDLSPLTVLSGLSGTGKSQLPRAYARFFGIHFLHVPVEPGWDSPQDLLGFYDFVAERYRPTDRARVLGHFDRQFAKEIGIEDDREWNERMLIILLDEMNLARTEYYFSEFLSRLEMRGSRSTVNGDEDSREDAQIAIDLPYAEGERPKHLYVPYNVLWVGSLNEDETTQALSDKVLDRANSIRFAPPKPDILRKHSTAPEKSISAADGYLPYERWLEWSERRTTVEPGTEQIDETLEELARLMQMADRGFGYRIAQSIKAYIYRYPGRDWRVPMIDQINMRLLPKLAGAEMSDCQETVEELRRLSEATLGNPAFAQALRNAATASEVSQIFTWPGYTYEETTV